MNRLNPIQPGSEHDASPDAVRFERILIPIDCAACPHEMLRYGRMFAAEFGAMVQLLHVVQLNIAGEERGIPRAGLIRQMREAARTTLCQWVRVLWDAEFPAMVMVRDGCPDEVIVQEARDTKADLILMGAPKHTGLSRLFRRSTAMRVLRRAPCPVLLLRLGESRVFAGRASKVDARFKGELGIRSFTMNL